MTFLQKLEEIIKKNNSLLCVGLDPDMDKLPHHLLNSENPIFEFNKAIIDATSDLVCSYKPNIAFYSAYGINGLRALQNTIDYLHQNYRDIPAILDAKRGDIGITAPFYAKEIFDVYKADAVTINPYLGFDSVEPFLKYKEKGIIVLCRTSNKGAEDIQDLRIDTIPLYIKVAQKTILWNKMNNNCLLVVGATWPEELKKIRKLAPDMFFLLPGIGKQGGDLKKSLRFGLTREKSGLIVNVGRAILYSSKEKDFAKKIRRQAMEFKNQINHYRFNEKE